MPKKGLGTGLASLMGDSSYEKSKQPENFLDIDDVLPNLNQPRKEFDEVKLKELSDSIKQHGILQPLLVRKSGAKYQIICGERRYQAAKLAELKQVPVVIREVSDADVLKLALIENLQRDDLNAIEEAVGFRELINEQGLTQEELGKVLSKSRSAITNSIRLLDLPKEVQDYLVQKKLTPGHARAILAVSSEEGRIKLADKVVNDRLSVRQTENLAPLFSGIGEEKPKRIPTPQSFKKVARELRLRLNTNVKVKRVRGINKIEIDFQDESDLERIINQILVSNKEDLNV